MTETANTHEWESFDGSSVACVKCGALVVDGNDMRLQSDAHCPARGES